MLIKEGNMMIPLKDVIRIEKVSEIINSEASFDHYTIYVYNFIYTNMVEILYITSFDINE